MSTADAYQSCDKQLRRKGKEFLGFGVRPGRIEIIMRSPPRGDECSVRYQNYPRFEHAVSPDDMITFTRLNSILTANYGEVLKMRFDCDVLTAEEPDREHRILVGGPYGNRMTKEANDELRSSGMYFDGDERNRVIVGRQGRYELETAIFDDGEYIVADYCLVSRKRGARGKVELIFAGLRAYGQMATNTFLSDIRFYEEAAEKVGGCDNFQMIVRAIVRSRQVEDWEIVECHAEKPGDASTKRRKRGSASGRPPGRPVDPAVQKRNAEIFEMFKDGMENDEVLEKMKKKGDGITADRLRRLKTDWNREEVAKGRRKPRPK
jgi:hypothetical protein